MVIDRLGRLLGRVAPVPPAPTRAPYLLRIAVFGAVAALLASAGDAAGQVQQHEGNAPAQSPRARQFAALAEPSPPIAPAVPLPAAVAAPTAPIVTPAVADPQARAAELIARGRNVEAIELLSQTVAAAPANSDARSLLAALHAEAGRRDLALNLLLAGSRIDPARFAAVTAQLQAALGEAAAALATLDRLPAAGRSARTDALEAAIAQRAAQHARAVEVWQRALRDKDAPSVWWAGLALSLDSLGQDAAAHAAYTRALADRALPAAARSYALGRIGALAAATPAERLARPDGVHAPAPTID